MILLIGGPARCGKTTLAKKVTGLVNIDHISLDALRHSLSAVTEGSVKSDLDVAPSHLKYTPEKWIGILRRRDRILWEGAKAYAGLASKNSDDVLMEGCIWPDFISGSGIPYRAVFIVDTSPNQAERLISATRDNHTHNNWLNGKSETFIRSWAKYNIERSKLYKKLAKQYGYPVFDVAELGFDSAQENAIEHLLGGGIL